MKSYIRKLVYVHYINEPSIVLCTPWQVFVITVPDVVVLQNYMSHLNSADLKMIRSAPIRLSIWGAQLHLWSEHWHQCSIFATLHFPSNDTGFFRPSKQGTAARSCLYCTKQLSCLWSILLNVQVLLCPNLSPLTILDADSFTKSSFQSAVLYNNNKNKSKH